MNGGRSEVYKKHIYEWDADTRRALEGKASLTDDEATQLQHLRNADYTALKDKVKDGETLSEAESARLGGYEAGIAAARAAEQGRSVLLANPDELPLIESLSAPPKPAESEHLPVDAVLRPPVASSSQPVDSHGALGALKAAAALKGMGELLRADSHVLGEVVAGTNAAEAAIQGEMRYIRERTQALQAVPYAEQTPEWREEMKGLHDRFEEIWMFDEGYREFRTQAEAKAAFMGSVGAATVVAPQAMIPLLGRMAIGGIAADVTRDVMLGEGVPQGEAEMLGLMTSLALAGHMAPEASAPTVTIAPVARTSVRDRVAAIEAGVSGESVRFTPQSANSSHALQKKLSSLESAQVAASKTVRLSDGRVRYYGSFRPATKEGPTAGSRIVTEHNPATGRVKQWNECYDHFGKVNRVRPKTLNGQQVNSYHYPLTAKEKAILGIES